MLEVYLIALVALAVTLGVQARRLNGTTQQVRPSLPDRPRISKRSER